MITQETLFDQCPGPDEPTTSLEEERLAREQQAKRDILRRMKDERAAWLEVMRAELRGIYEYRVIEWGEAKAYVTADDARNQLRAYPDRFPLPVGATMNIMGPLFQSREWAPMDKDPEGRPIALHVSTTPGSRGNHLIRWKFVGERKRAVA